jgi:hypothetical protein
MSHARREKTEILQLIILSVVGGTTDGIWTGNWICSTLTARNCYLLIPTLCTSLQHVRCVFTLPGDRSSAAEHTSLPAGDCLTTNSLLLLSALLRTITILVLLITSRHGPHRNNIFQEILLHFVAIARPACRSSFPCCCLLPLPSTGRCLQGYTNYNIISELISGVFDFLFSEVRLI